MQVGYDGAGTENLTQSFFFRFCSTLDAFVFVPRCILCLPEIYPFILLRVRCLLKRCPCFCYISN